ncbi:MAG: Rieske (2Fe-2S) protein [Gammaproteobacteria bacterium]|nr:Rieske (2Fe-2S) protein [Gammaproteobacteria bacterium]
MKTDPCSHICFCRDLENSGIGVRFTVQIEGQSHPAFVIRFRDEIKAFVNECSHIGVELDWQPGIFFDITGQQIVCSTHGARYSPLSGKCIAGPCGAKGLIPLKVQVVEEEVHLVIEKGVHLVKIIEGQTDV